MSLPWLASFFPEASLTSNSQRMGASTVRKFRDGPENERRDLILSASIVVGATFFVSSGVRAIL